MSRLVQLPRLRGKFHGQTAVIVACGWSLEGFDWERLSAAPVVTIGVNRIIKAFAPDFWFLSEESRDFLPFAKHLDPKTLAVIRKCEVSDRILHNKHKDNCVALYTPHDTKNVPAPEYERPGGPFERGELWTKATVTMGALELARFLGFGRAVMIGCDLAMKPGSGQYYWDATIPAKRLNDPLNSVLANGEQYTTNKNLDRMRAWLGTWAGWVGGRMDKLSFTPGLVPNGFLRISEKTFWGLAEECS